MNPNLSGFAAIILAFVAFGFSYKLAVKWQTLVRVCAALVCLLASAPAFGVTLYYLHVLPETAWFYEMRSWRGSEFLSVPVGAFMGVMASLFHRWLLSLWMVLLGGMVAVPFVKPILAPLNLESLQDQWSGNALLQSTYSTCGPASVATILKQLGCPVTEREVARACYSYVGGTEAWYLARFIRSKGLTAKFEFHDSFKPDLKYPAVAGVRVGTGGHFIAILSKIGDEYVIADPLYGERRCPLKELKQRYDFTGFYMEVSRKRGVGVSAKLPIRGKRRAWGAHVLPARHSEVHPAHRGLRFDPLVDTWPLLHADVAGAAAQHCCGCHGPRPAALVHRA